jgi:hypothetical protein
MTPPVTSHKHRHQSLVPPVQGYQTLELLRRQQLVSQHLASKSRGVGLRTKSVNQGVFGLKFPLVKEPEQFKCLDVFSSDHI